MKPVRSIFREVVMRIKVVIMEMGEEGVHC